MKDLLASIKNGSYISLILVLSSWFFVTSLANNGLYIKEISIIFAGAIFSSTARQIFKDLTYKYKDANNYLWLAHWILQLFILVLAIFIITPSDASRIGFYQQNIKITDNTRDLIMLMSSAFFGGFFAAYWTNKYEAKRRMDELRRDKYFEHKNTIVQLEHELIPLRVSMSRNIQSLRIALEDSSETTYVILQRLFPLTLSSGLSLKLLDLDLINEYSNLHSEITSINADILYHDSLVKNILEDRKNGVVDESQLGIYRLIIESLYKSCVTTDATSKIILGKAVALIALDDTEIKNNYIKNGGLIIYNLDKHIFDEKIKNITEQEDPEKHSDKKQFVAPFLKLNKPAK